MDGTGDQGVRGRRSGRGTRGGRGSRGARGSRGRGVRGGRSYHGRSKGPSPDGFESQDPFLSAAERGSSGSSLGKNSVLPTNPFNVTAPAKVPSVSAMGRRAVVPTDPFKTTASPKVPFVSAAGFHPVVPTDPFRAAMPAKRSIGQNARNPSPLGDSRSPWSRSKGVQEAFSSGRVLSNSERDPLAEGSRGPGEVFIGRARRVDEATEKENGTAFGGASTGRAFSPGSRVTGNADQLGARLGGSWTNVGNQHTGADAFGRLPRRGQVQEIRTVDPFAPPTEECLTPTAAFGVGFEAPDDVSRRANFGRSAEFVLKSGDYSIPEGVGAVQKGAHPSSGKPEGELAPRQLHAGPVSAIANDTQQQRQRESEMELLRAKIAAAEKSAAARKAARKRSTKSHPAMLKDVDSGQKAKSIMKNSSNVLQTENCSGEYGNVVANDSSAHEANPKDVPGSHISQGHDASRQWTPKVLGHANKSHAVDEGKKLGKIRAHEKRSHVSKKRSLERARNPVKSGQDAWRAMAPKMDLEDAVDFVGVCEMMCPEKEISTRADISVFEKRPLGDPLAVVVPAFMVKKYMRSAAAAREQGAENVRPPNVLNRTMEYLFSDVLDNDSFPYGDRYHFVNDRSRCVRQDLTFQGAALEEASIAVLEKGTRFQIMSEHKMCGNESFSSKLNMEQLEKCLISVLAMYKLRKDAGLPCPNEPEFQAYNLLCFPQPQHVGEALGRMDVVVLRSVEVQFVVTAMAYISEPNMLYTQYCEMILDAPYLVACLMFKKLTSLRSAALRIMVRVMGIPRRPERMPISHLKEKLVFEDDAQASRFCEWHSLVVTGGLAILEASRFMDSPELPWQEAPASRLVESKIFGLRLSDVVCGHKLGGYGTRSAQHLSLGQKIQKPDELPKSPQQSGSPRRSEIVGLPLHQGVVRQGVSDKSEHPFVSRARVHSKKLVRDDATHVSPFVMPKLFPEKTVSLGVLQDGDVRSFSRSGRASSRACQSPTNSNTPDSTPRFTVAPAHHSSPGTWQNPRGISGTPLVSTTLESGGTILTYSLDSRKARGEVSEDCSLPLQETLPSEPELGVSGQNSNDAIAARHEVRPSFVGSSKPTVISGHVNESGENDIRGESPQNLPGTLSDQRHVAEESVISRLRMCIMEFRELSIGGLGLSALKYLQRDLKHTSSKHIRARAQAAVEELSGFVVGELDRILTRVYLAAAESDSPEVHSLKTTAETAFEEYGRVVQSALVDLQACGYRAAMEDFLVRGPDALEEYESAMMTPGVVQERKGSCTFTADPLACLKRDNTTGFDSLDVDVDLVLPDILTAMYMNCVSRFQVVLLSWPWFGNDALLWTEGMLSRKKEGDILALETTRDQFWRSYLSVVAATPGHLCGNAASVVVVPVDFNVRQPATVASVSSVLRGELVTAKEKAAYTTTPPAVVVVVNATGVLYSHEADAKTFLDLSGLKSENLLSDYRVVSVGLSENNWNAVGPQNDFRHAMEWAVTCTSISEGRRTGYVRVRDVALSRANDSWMNFLEDFHGSENPFRDVVLLINETWRLLSQEISRESCRWPSEFAKERDTFAQLSRLAETSLCLPCARDLDLSVSKSFLEGLASTVNSGKELLVELEMFDGSFKSFCDYLGRLLPAFVRMCLGSAEALEVDLPFAPPPVYMKRRRRPVVDRSVFSVVEKDACDSDERPAKRSKSVVTHATDHGQTVSRALWSSPRKAVIGIRGQRTDMGEHEDRQQFFKNQLARLDTFLEETAAYVKQSDAWVRRMSTPGSAGRRATSSRSAS